MKNSPEVVVESTPTVSVVTKSRESVIEDRFLEIRMQQAYRAKKAKSRVSSKISKFFSIFVLNSAGRHINDVDESMIVCDSTC